MYNVIRSSKTNLEALDLFLNTQRPGSLYRPKMTVMRRTRTSRRLQPHSVQMYPGYAFVHPSMRHELELVSQRWTHHYLRSPTTNKPLTVPEDQLHYALEIERRSLVLASPLPQGTRVIFSGGGRLDGRTGTIQNCFGYYATVWVDDLDYPVQAVIADLTRIE